MKSFLTKLLEKRRQFFLFFFQNSSNEGSLNKESSKKIQQCSKVQTARPDYLSRKIKIIIYKVYYELWEFFLGAYPVTLHHPPTSKWKRAAKRCPPKNTTCKSVHEKCENILSKHTIFSGTIWFRMTYISIFYLREECTWLQNINNYMHIIGTCLFRRRHSSFR